MLFLVFLVLLMSRCIRQKAWKQELLNINQTLSNQLFLAFPVGSWFFHAFRSCFLLFLVFLAFLMSRCLGTKPVTENQSNASASSISGISCLQLVFSCFLFVFSCFSWFSWFSSCPNVLGRQLGSVRMGVSTSLSLSAVEERLGCRAMTPEAIGTY